LAEIESPCTILYRPLIVTFALSSTVSGILPVLYAQSQLRKYKIIKCTSAEYVGLIEIMHPTTLHGVGVITKLYFVIFAAFMESMTLNLVQRSLTIIHFGGNRKPV